MEMNKSFETKAMNVMIEDVTVAGSAFGSNEDGDTVFFNARLVERMKLDFGDIVVAAAIPNYEDKRAETPWRAVRVSAAQNTEEKMLNNLEILAPVPAARTAPQLDAEIYAALQDPEVSYWTSSDLGSAVDADTKTVGNSCLRLFNKGCIAKADVHGGPDQDRASFCLWARNADQFK
jgi:hypothetical protein